MNSSGEAGLSRATPNRPPRALSSLAGEWRLVVDYRGLNAQTQHDSYTLPLIEDMLQKRWLS